MNIPLKVVSFLLLIYSVHPLLHAQQGFVASGGDVSSVDGSIAFSIGQIDFVSFSSETGHVLPGLQQPVGYTLVNTSVYNSVKEVRLYPNPANEFIILQIDPLTRLFSNHTLVLKIFDLRGQLVLSNKLTLPINTIQINTILPGFYLAQVWQANTFIQSFPFVKTN